MWKAIRLHPWRLEIVPAAAFALTVWSAYVYETRVAWLVRRIPEMRDSGLSWLPWLLLAILLQSWFILIGHNQSWVQSERRKRLNYPLLVLQAGPIFFAWSAYAFTFLFLQVMHRHAIPRIPVLLLAFMLLGGTGITTLQEWSRKYVPREEEPEPPLPGDAVSSHDYREIAIDWWMLPAAIMYFGLVIACRAAGLFTYGEHSGMESVVGAVVLVAATILVFSLSRTMLTVTPTALTYWSGPARVRLHIAEMLGCVPSRRDPNESRGAKRTTWCRRGQRCVDITMTNGRIYRLGALRPTHICHLIGKPAAAELKTDD